MFRYDIQCDNSYSDHTRYVCSLTPEEAGDDQLSHNLICLSLLGLGFLLLSCCWIRTSCCLQKTTKTHSAEPHCPPPPPDCLETCGDCQEDERRRRSQEVEEVEEECPGCSECCCCQEMEEISHHCQETLQSGQPTVKKTQIRRVSNIEKKIIKNNSLRK